MQTDRSDEDNRCSGEWKSSGQIRRTSGSGDEEMQKEALELPAVKRQLEGKEIRKIIVVKGKVVNIVAG